MQTSKQLRNISHLYVNIVSFLAKKNSNLNYNLNNSPIDFHFKIIATEIST